MSNPPNNALVPVNNINQAVIPFHRQRIFPPRVMVFFINTTDTIVNVRWLNSDNTYKDYGDLHPKSYRHVSTFYGHRWAFYDTKDGELLTTNYNSPDDEEEIYFAAKLPENYILGEESPKQNVLIFRRRTVETLTYSALKAVARRPDLMQLQLAPKIKEALISYYQERQAFLQQWRRDVAARQPRPA
uniref:von Hippel-Lindau disease tumour suppressor beta domain-containing protein n=1 Tax=Panagrolaimus sp. PS1159 TaxID=55785 RepID=A0AC35G150_9BILA